MKNDDTILVTGAHGLVGSAVVNHLRASGFVNVVGPSSKDCDLRKAGETGSLFRYWRPDYVFHAAARVFGIVGNMNNQGLSYFENTLINTNVIEAARLVGVKKITAMGTNAAYPFPTMVPFRESLIFDGRPHSSESGYAHAKRGMLAMLEAYEESYGLDWAYLVSCNLYGPRDKFDPINGHVVPSLIRKFHEASGSGKPVTIWGDGSAQRDFLYVKDTAHAAFLIMERGHGAINLGDGTVRSIRTVVDALSVISGVTNIVWDSTKPNGQLYRTADLSRLSALGFNPSYSLEEGLKETWDWFCHEQAH